jgi:hypothetical protein
MEFLGLQTLPSRASGKNTKYSLKTWLKSGASYRRVHYLDLKNLSS